MAGWHHWLDGRESQWSPGVGDGQGGLACCDSWGCKESDMTEQLIRSDNNCFQVLYGSPLRVSFACFSLCIFTFPYLCKSHNIFCWKLDKLDNNQIYTNLPLFLGLFVGVVVCLFVCTFWSSWLVSFHIELPSCKWAEAVKIGALKFLICHTLG